jgi:hypothetical protein
VSYLAAIPILAGLPFLIRALLLFDRLIKLEYGNHHETWISDGRPAGMWWRSPECMWFTSDISRVELMFSWMFKDPGWIGEGSDEKRILRSLRWSVLIWNVLIPMSVVMSILSPNW